MIKLAAALVLVWFSLPSFAADSSGQFGILGFGSQKCSVFVQASANEDKVFKEKLFAAAIQSWINGYLTGVSASTPGLVDISAGLDSPTRSNWVLEYCKRNPDQKIDSGVQSLVRELRSK